MTDLPAKKTKIHPIILGILLGTLLTAFFTVVFFYGILMGVMGTDSCRHVDGGPLVYLFFVWPLLLLISAWAPSTMYWLKLSGLKILIFGLILGFGSLVAYIIYPIWLGYACHR